jgi:tmRNA-binding protein
MKKTFILSLSVVGIVFSGCTIKSVQECSVNLNSCKQNIATKNETNKSIHNSNCQTGNYQKDNCNRCYIRQEIITFP